MCAAAHDLAVLEDEDLVRTHDGRHALRDDDNGRFRGDARKRRPQPGVGAEVQRGKRVVEQIDLRSAHQRARDRESLALSA